MRPPGCLPTVQVFTQLIKRDFKMPSSWVLGARTRRPGHARRRQPRGLRPRFLTRTNFLTRLHTALASAPVSAIMEKAHRVPGWEKDSLMWGYERPPGAGAGGARQAHLCSAPLCVVSVAQHVTPLADIFNTFRGLHRHVHPTRNVHPTCAPQSSHGDLCQATFAKPPASNISTTSISFIMLNHRAWYLTAFALFAAAVHASDVS